MRNLENVRVTGKDGKSYPATHKGNEARNARAMELRAQGWTLQAVAEELGCSLQTIHRVTTSK